MCKHTSECVIACFVRSLFCCAVFLLIHTWFHQDDAHLSFKFKRDRRIENKYQHPKNHTVSLDVSPAKAKKNQKEKNDRTPSTHIAPFWCIKEAQEMLEKKGHSSIYTHELNEFGNIFSFFFHLDVMGVINSASIHWNLFRACHKERERKKLNKKIKNRKRLTTQLMRLVIHNNILWWFSSIFLRQIRWHPLIVAAAAAADF